MNFKAKKSLKWVDFKVNFKAKKSLKWVDFKVNSIKEAGTSVLQPYRNEFCYQNEMEMNSTLELTEGNADQLNLDFRNICVDLLTYRIKR